jgi:DNA repair exonuclease SbcCD nuclease subunit
MPRMALRIAHLSDTHLGYEAYPALSAAGNNQRGEDVVRAMQNVVNDIVSWQPDLIIHSGDVLEKPKTDIRYMLVAQQLFRKLAAVAPVVVIAGNHELPRSRKEACWLDLLAGTPGLHIVTSRYEVIRPAGLDGVAVHAVPHDVLKEIDQSVIVPSADPYNILVAHGVATGSELFLRSLGREYAIEADTLLRDWSYAALGHWHRQGPVHLGASGVVKHVWYAGSTENMGFRDLRDNGDQRGYLRVSLDGTTCTVTPVCLPTRPMFRLPVVDGAGLDATGIADRMVAHLDDAVIDGSVVGQVVTGVNRDMWSLVDVARVRGAAKAALHYEITVRYATEEARSAGPDATVDAFEAILGAQIATLVPEPYRDAVTAKAKTLIGASTTAEVER